MMPCILKNPRKSVRLLPDSLGVKNDSDGFTGLTEGLELSAVQLGFNTAGVGQFKSDGSVCFPLYTVTDDKVIILGCGPVDGDCQRAALGNP